MRYRTVDCCPMAATQKMSCAPLSPLAASSAGSFNNSPVNSGILPTDSPEEPVYDGRADRRGRPRHAWIGDRRHTHPVIRKISVIVAYGSVCRICLLRGDVLRAIQASSRAQRGSIDRGLELGLDGIQNTGIDRQSHHGEDDEEHHHRPNEDDETPFSAPLVKSLVVHFP